MTLREYIELYSGATITFKTGDGKHKEIKLVKYGELDKTLNEFKDSDYWRWDAEQTKECRFMPCLSNNKVDENSWYFFEKDMSLIKTDPFKIDEMLKEGWETRSTSIYDVITDEINRRRK